MSTILTDDEIATAIAHLYAGPEVLAMALPDELHSARAIEAAVLAKLARQEPVAWIANDSGYNYVQWAPNKNWPVGTKFYTHPAPQQADRHALQNQGKHPAPCARFCESKAYEIEIRQLKSQLGQADRQRVPEGWREALQTARDAMAKENRIIPSAKFTAAISRIDAMLTAAPEAPAQSEQLVQAYRTSAAYDVGFADGKKYASQGCGRCEDITKPCDISGVGCAAPEAPAQAEQAAEPVRELVAKELERIAQDPPISGNEIAQARVLMAAQSIREFGLSGGAALASTERQPLTDEQIVNMANPTQHLPDAPEGWVRFGFSRRHLVGFARSIERAHGIGGEGKR